MSKTHISLLSLAAALFVAIAAIAGANDEGIPPGAGITQVTTVEEEAADAMDVLEEPRTAADAMPPDVAEGFDAERDFGMNPDLSRRPIANVSNSVYIVPANDHVCASLTMGAGAGITCYGLEELTAGEVGAATATLENGAIGIYGIVPDGVEEVVVEMGASDSEAFPVEGNAYFVALPQGTPLRTIGYTGPSGPVEFPLYDPAEAFDEE